MSVAHLNRLVEEREHETECVVFKLVQISPINQIDCIEQCIKSSLCFHLENNIVKNEDSSILLKCKSTRLVISESGVRVNPGSGKLSVS